MVLLLSMGETVAVDLKDDGDIKELADNPADDVELIDKDTEDGEEVKELDPQDLFSLFISIGCL